ncbi:MAG: hypothetical protein ABIB43_00970 [archaeon]
MIKLSYTKKIHDKNSFLKMIEKRVRKDLRINKKIEPKKVELLVNGSKESLMTKVLLENIFGKHLQITEVKKATNKTLIPTNLDSEIENNLDVYLKNKQPIKNKLKILDNVLEEEIIIFCKLKNIKIRKIKKENSLIESIDKKYPGTKFALAKSFEKIFS